MPTGMLSSLYMETGDLLWVDSDGCPTAMADYPKPDNQGVARLFSCFSTDTPGYPHSDPAFSVDQTSTPRLASGES